MKTRLLHLLSIIDVSLLTVDQRLCWRLLFQFSESCNQKKKQTHCVTHTSKKLINLKDRRYLCFWDSNAYLNMPMHKHLICSFFFASKMFHKHQMWLIVHIASWIKIRVLLFVARALVWVTLKKERKKPGAEVHLRRLQLICSFLSFCFIHSHRNLINDFVWRVTLTTISIRFELNNSVNRIQNTEQFSFINS